MSTVAPPWYRMSRKRAERPCSQGRGRSAYGVKIEYLFPVSVWVSLPKWPNV
jgi:hypothetical protein